MQKIGFDVVDAALAGILFVKEKPKLFAVWSLLMSVPVFLMVLLGILLVGLLAVLVPGGGMIGAGSDWVGNSISLTVSLLCIPFLASIGLQMLGKSRANEWKGLSLGKFELMTLIYYLALTAILTVAVIVVVLIAAVLGGLAYWLGGVGASVLVITPIVLAAIIALVWGMVRLSLVLPACLDAGRFIFAAPWAATKGRFWPLFGTGVLMTLLVLVLQIAIGFGALIVGGVLAGLGFLAYQVAGWWGTVPFFFIGGAILLVVTSALSVTLVAIQWGPYFHIWRALNETQPAETVTVQTV